MKAPQLASVWRSVSIGANITVPDAELLRRYQLDKSEDDFAALVQRYGRLVWMVCRNLTRCEADADDAFQAVFLVFLRNAHKLRDAGKLPAWLHGVAYRVCSKARLAATRRKARETKRAKPDAAVPVPDSRWDEALAAVQEEVARLPENLRVPFVVCCLEGVGVVEAAKMLGWKLGTLSGRLTRAKDRLMAKLEARGVVMSLAGFVSGLAVATAPAASVAKVMLISTVGAVVPTTILQLSTGVLGMGSTKLKLLLAGLFITGGLGLGVGSGWINTAGAQQSGGPAKEKLDAKVLQEQERVLLLIEQELASTTAKRAAVKQQMEATAKALAEQKKALADQQKVTRLFDVTQRKIIIDANKDAEKLVLDLHYDLTGATTDVGKWQYDIVPWEKMKIEQFKTMLTKRDKEGWEYVGSNDFTDGTVTFVSWVFRKPTKDQVTKLDLTNRSADTLTLTGKVINQDVLSKVEVRPNTVSAPSANKLFAKDVFADTEVQQLRAQIEMLQALLNKVESGEKKQVYRYLPNKVSAELFSDTLDYLSMQGSKKFPNDLKLTNQRETASLLLEGSPVAVKWAKEMLDKLIGARAASPELPNLPAAGK